MTQNLHILLKQFKHLIYSSSFLPYNAGSKHFLQKLSLFLLNVRNTSSSAISNTFCLPKEYCKIYYRKTPQIPAKFSFIKEFFTTLIFFVIGYILIVCTTFTKTSICLQKTFNVAEFNKSNSSIYLYRLRYVLYIIAYMILLIITLPLVIIIMPFFPSLLHSIDVFD